MPTTRARQRLFCRSWLVWPGPHSRLIPMQDMRGLDPVARNNVLGYFDWLAILCGTADPDDLQHGKHDRYLQQGGFVLAGQAAPVELHPGDGAMSRLLQPV